MKAKIFPTYKTASVESLIPYARNSRTHSESQITKIAASIKEFGFLNPVIIDAESGIIAGHGRVMAAKKLGMADVPVIEAIHLSDAQRRAYIIADNRIALDAGWDDDLLRIEMEDLDSLGLSLDLTGFAEFEIESIMQKDQDDSAFEMDYEPEVDSKEKTKTDEGYAEFSLVLQVENKKRLLQAMNNIKAKHDTSSNEDAIMIMCDSFA